MPEYASNYIIIILYLYSTGKVLILWNMFAFDFDPLGGAEVLKIPSLQEKPPYVRPSVRASHRGTPSINSNVPSLEGH